MRRGSTLQSCSWAIALCHVTLILSDWAFMTGTTGQVVRAHVSCPTPQSGGTQTGSCCDSSSTYNSTHYTYLEFLLYYSLHHSIRYVAPTLVGPTQYTYSNTLGKTGYFCIDKLNLLNTTQVSYFIWMLID